MKLCEHPEFVQAVLRASDHFRSRGLRKLATRLVASGGPTGSPTCSISARSVAWPLDAFSVCRFSAAKEPESHSSRQNRHANCGVRAGRGLRRRRQDSAAAIARRMEFSVGTGLPGSSSGRRRESCQTGG